MEPQWPIVLGQLARRVLAAALVILLAALADLQLLDGQVVDRVCRDLAVVPTPPELK